MAWSRQPSDWSGTNWPATCPASARSASRWSPGIAVRCWTMGLTVIRSSAWSAEVSMRIKGKLSTSRNVVRAAPAPTQNWRSGRTWLQL